jgi:phosphoglucomutase
VPPAGSVNRTGKIIAEAAAAVKQAEPSGVGTYDYRGNYVNDLENIISMEAIKKAGVHIGADPLGGASVHYWSSNTRLGFPVSKTQQ